MGSKALGTKVNWDPSPEILYWNDSWKALATITSQSFQPPLAQGEGEEGGVWKLFNEINVQFYYRSVFH